MKKKIAYIITLPILGGAQSHVYELMAHINEYDYETLLITGSAGWLTEKADELGIKCYIVPSIVREISPANDIKALYDVCKILKKEHPQIIHCHSSKAGIIGRIAGKMCGINTVFTAHGWAFTEGISSKKRWLYCRIENFVGYFTDKIICVSEYDHQLGANNLPAHKDKMLTLHNAIPDLPQYVRDWETHSVGDVLHCVVVARFSPPKKNVELLHILRKLLDDGMSLDITFIGDGPDYAKARAVTQVLGLESSAFFLGARSDVPELLPQYDLLILLSNWEGLPISIIEAMRAGLPVLASDVGGVSEEVLHHETGWLVQKGNEQDELVACLADALQNKSIFQEFGQNGRAIYQEKFNIKEMVNQIHSVYQELQ